MSIVVAGFDVHRAQITFDVLDRATGESRRGRIPASPQGITGWCEGYAGRELHVAVEACTGWYFVCRALAEAGATPHLAELAETHARRGRKRRAKTDFADAAWLRTLLDEGRLPEAWIPPEYICQLRTRTRLRKTLVDERRAWQQRIRATLFHLGHPSGPERLLGAEGRAFLAGLELPGASAQRIEVCLAMIDALEGQLVGIEAELAQIARHQPGCRALMGHFGIGLATAPAILAEMGDARRLSRSRAAVRLAGLDVGVHRSDRRARVGRLTKQGSPQLRFALYEAAQSATRPTSPDHGHYLELRERMSHTRASLTIARKLARRCYHTLRALGPEALAPAA